MVHTGGGSKVVSGVGRWQKGAGGGRRWREVAEIAKTAGGSGR